jgi:omega-amidase
LTGHPRKKLHPHLSPGLTLLPGLDYPYAMINKLLTALIQMHVTGNKAENLQKARDWIERCAGQGAGLVMLPEMFCCPYDSTSFPRYAEPEGGPAWQALSDAARKAQVYLVGGSMPEVDSSGGIYNTCYLFDPGGRQVGKHRKMHLFDIDVTNGQRFRESDTLSPGNQITVVETNFGKLGVAICYDLRFPELARLMTLEGAKILAYPGAFNMTTGPAHWEILFRTRALDNQVYLLGCAPARDETAGYISYAHSLVVSPWGKIVAQLGAKEGCLLTGIDLEEVEQVRRELPLLQHRRTDVYELGYSPKVS